MKRLNRSHENLTIQDFAGQPEYYASHQYFLGVGNAVYVLVFDLRDFVVDRVSATIHRAMYWLNFLGSAQTDRSVSMPIVLVATHGDCDEKVTLAAEFRSFAKDFRPYVESRFGVVFNGRVRSGS